MNTPNIKRASLDDIRKMAAEGSVSRPAQPLQGEELGEEFWADAVLVEPKAPTLVHLKVDPEVFNFFKRQGRDISPACRRY